MNITYLVMDANLHHMDQEVKRRPGQHHGDLRNALLVAAQALVAERGPRGFTMAEAARRAGVSVAAPYKHFADREALLVALAQVGYQEQERRFVAAVAGAGAPGRQLAAAAEAYVDFALESSALFDVVYNSGMDKAAHPELGDAARHMLDVLLKPAADVAGEGAEELLVSVAVLAHGYATFLLAGTLGPVPDVVPDIKRRLRHAVVALVDASPP